MADTALTIDEIEVAIAKSRDFSCVANTVVFNVYGLSELLPIGHECDVLVMTKAGYLAEIEIKRSWSDFLADFRKAHKHESRLIKRFYYCVPESIFRRVMEYIENAEDEYKCAGVAFYTEDGRVWIRRGARVRDDALKLTDEQKLEVLRLGCMKVIAAKERFIRERKKNNSKEE